MHPGDQSTNDDPAYDTPALQTSLFPLPRSHPLPIREFLTTDQPRHRLTHQGASALSDAELLAVITGVPCLETTQRLLIAAGGLRGLQALSTVELQQLVTGISVGRAAQIKAAIELGTRVARGDQAQRCREDAARTGRSPRRPDAMSSQTISEQTIRKRYSAIMTTNQPNWKLILCAVASRSQTRSKFRATVRLRARVLAKQAAQLPIRRGLSTRCRCARAGHYSTTSAT